MSSYSTHNIRNIGWRQQKNMQNACEALVQEVMLQNKKNQDNVTVILLAKIENDEPQTVLYNESTKSFFYNKKKLALYAGIAALFAAIVVFALFFLSGEKSKLRLDKNTSIKDTIKIQEEIKKTEQ